MRHSERRSRIAGATLSVVVTSAVAAWALAHTTTRLAPAVALAGIAGIATFTAALTAPFAPMRNRTIATGLVLVGTAAVVGALGEAVSIRERPRHFGSGPVLRRRGRQPDDRSATPR